MADGARGVFNNGIRKQGLEDMGRMGVGYCHEHGKHGCQVCIDDLVAVGIQADKDRIKAMTGLLLWALYHHQGATSPIGQPIRKLLGIGEHENLTHEQVVEAQIAAGVR